MDVEKQTAGIWTTYGAHQLTVPGPAGDRAVGLGHRGRRGPASRASGT